MRLMITLALVLALSGCAVQMGKITPGSEIADQKCAGIYLSFGETTGPCGMQGGAISAPGAGLIGAALKAVGDLAGSVLGRNTVVIQPAATD